MILYLHTFDLKSFFKVKTSLPFILNIDLKGSQRLLVVVGDGWRESSLISSGGLSKKI